MGRSTTSLRLDDELRQKLAVKAAASDTTVSALIERLVREGLAMDAHPGIVFRPGPAGRRPGVTNGLDVWEIVSALRDFDGTEAERVAAFAEQMGMHPSYITVALDYAAAHREEIENWIAENDRGFEEGERLAAERARLLK